MRTKLPGVETAACVESPKSRAQEQSDGEEHERGSEQVREPVHHVLLYVARTLEGQEREDPFSSYGSDGHDTVPDFSLLISEEAQDGVQGVHGRFQSYRNHSGG